MSKDLHEDTQELADAISQLPAMMILELLGEFLASLLIKSPVPPDKYDEFVIDVSIYAEHAIKRRKNLH